MQRLQHPLWSDLGSRVAACWAANPKWLRIARLVMCLHPSTMPVVVVVVGVAAG